MLRQLAEVALVGARREDVADLLDGEAQLVVRGEEVRAEPEAGVGPEVAQNLPLGELTVDGGEVGNVNRDGAAAPLRRERAAHLEAGGVCEIDEELRLAERVRPDPLYPDLLDQVVAC